MPPDYVSNIVIKINNKQTIIKVNESDTFKNFFNLIFNDYTLNKKKNLHNWHNKLLENFNNLQLINSKL